MMKNKKNVVRIVIAFLVIIFLAQGFFYWSMVRSYNLHRQEIVVLRGQTEQIVAFINQILAEQQ